MRELLFGIQENIELTKPSKKNKIYVLKEQEFQLLNNYLLQNDSEYCKIVKENMTILSHSKSKLQTYKDNSSYFGTYTSQLLGDIHNNGTLYVRGVKSPFPWFGFTKNVYAKKFKGNIDWRGDIKLKVSKKGFLLFGSRIPERFNLKINDSGYVNAIMDKYSFDFMGSAFMDKLICDPFNHSEIDKKNFLSNRRTLFDKLQSLKLAWMS